MGLLLTVLIGILASLIGGLYLLGVFRRRKPGEPPLDKGLIPWLGHLLEFRSNTMQFLERMKQKHGDVVTIQLGGFYTTFIQDPLSFAQFEKDSREKFDFKKLARSILYRVFDYQPQEDVHHIVQSSSNKYLKGDGLKVMIQSLMTNFQNLMLHRIDAAADKSTWIEDGLFMYSCVINFGAGFLSLFGNTPPESEGSEEKAIEKDRTEMAALFSEWRKYDHLFPDEMIQLQTPKEKSETKRLKKIFWKALSVEKLKNKDNLSRWIWDIQQFRNDTGMKESMIDRYMFVLLWASQGNPGPASFWLLFFLMKDPEAMAAVKEEVDRIVKESGQEVRRGGPLFNLTDEMLMKASILDSAVEESLRLTAAPLLPRDVLQDTTFKMADGREYFIRKGDRVAVFPYSAVQMDPEVHADPISFKYDRFLNPDGSKKTDFYKKGKKVKYYSMPFGTGISMCPGRYYAWSQIKQFVFLMLVYFEFELKNPDEKRPGFTRWGIGSMQPANDVQFRYRLRY